MLQELSKRLSQIKPSSTMAVNAKAVQLQREGRNIINLSVGEPDFDTPEFIKQAGIQAIQEGFTKYTATDGLIELKDAIIQKFKKDNQLTYHPKQVMVSCGVKQVFFNLTQALLNESDEVIIPVPYWVSYPEMVKLAGAKVVYIHSSVKNCLKLTAEQLEKAITPQTRLFILNSPNNPTGMVYTADELKKLAEVLKKYPRIIIGSDDIYEYILWDVERYVNIVNVCPELQHRTVLANGLSKAYAMTGWRIGYVAASETIISAMKKIQSQSTTCVNSIAQKAAIVALNTPRNFFSPILATYKMRHDIMLSALNKIDGVECLASNGTFYLFPNVQSLIKRLGLEDDIHLAEFLLEKAGVAVIPGSAFGSASHIRISCATSNTNLHTAIRLMLKVLK